MKRLCALLAAFAVALVGCSSPPHGKVTAKAYVASHTDLEWQTQYGSRCTMEIVLVKVGNTYQDEDENVCSQYVIGMRLMPVYYPECWQLTVAGRIECVSADQYSKTKIGDTV